MNFVAKQKALQNFVVACTGLSTGKVIWGGQQGPRPAQDAINMRLMLIDDNGRPWLDIESNPLEIDDLAITSVTGDVLTSADHELNTGDGPFHLVGGDLPGGLAEDTDYWFIKVSDTTFKLAASFLRAKAGTNLTLSSTGSGSMDLVSTADSLTAGAEILYKQRSIVKAVLTLEAYSAAGTGDDMTTAILWRVVAKRMLPSLVSLLEDEGIALNYVDSVKFIGGKQDLVLFEPRALLDIHLTMTSEEEETGTIIETTEITNEDTGDMFTVSVD